MNKDRWKKLMYGLVAALLLSACSQDELADHSTALPEGEYPLQIGSVTLTAEVSEQPWTRVSENPTDGMSSEFKAGDAIGVSLNGETATYTYDGTAWTSEAPLYWKDKNYATVTAWYPVEEEIDFTQQDVKGLTYLLKANGVEAGFDKPANLTFTHQLAKVRVVLEGDKANEVQTVTVRSHLTSPNNKQGDLGSLTSTENKYVPMMEATYNGQRCWEANLRPGYLEADNTFEVAKAEGDPVRVTLDDNVTIKAGQVHTITINVEQAPKEIDLDTYEGTTLTVSGKTILKGDGQQKNLQITVEPNTELTLQDVNLSNQGSAPVVFKGDATLTLEGANTLEGECVAWDFNSATLTLEGANTLEGKCVAWDFKSGSGIYIEQGTLTINADNEDASLAISRKYNWEPNSSTGMGIYVPENASLIIKSGKITVNDVSSEGDDSGAGIGTRSETCGNITIEGGNITVGKCSWYAAGIGSRDGDCKGITITGENTVVNVSKGDLASCYIGSGNGTVTGNITIGGGATVNGVKYTETHTGTL